MNRTMLRIFSIALLGLISLPTSAAEEGSVKAFVVWQGSGQTVQTATSAATFIGSISGTVYVETAKGPVASGQMTCPSTMHINLETGAQNGIGNCVMTAPDGGQIYGEFACSGVHLVGCDGDFKLTGGTGRFEGITGGGRAVLRASERTLTDVGGTGLVEAGSGILFWQKLSYKLP